MNNRATPIYVQNLNDEASEIIDVRMPGDYANLHISSAKNISDFSQLTQVVLNNPRTKFLLHCYIGHTVALYGSYLANMSARNVCYFDGNFEEIYQALEQSNEK